MNLELNSISKKFMSGTAVEILAIVVIFCRAVSQLPLTLIASLQARYMHPAHAFNADAEEEVEMMLITSQPASPHHPLRLYSQM